MLQTYQLPNTLSASIFRAYDIRGIVGDTLTSDVVYAIGKAIGTMALQQGEQTVIIARDGRLSGPSLSHALSAGLLSTGCDVLDIGEVPTPVLYFATHNLASKSGVMLTGSHNPPDYNGLKIVVDGKTLAEEEIQALYQSIIQRNLNSGAGKLKHVSVTEDYIQHIVKDVVLKRSYKVVVDCGNGVPGKIAPALLRALGCEVIELFCEIDGHFPNHHPDPSEPKNLQDLIKTVKSHHADIGLAFDGDGDRLGVVTDAGEIIWPDRQLMLYAQDVLSRHPGAEIIYDVKCSRHLGQVIKAHQGKPLMWKTGHSLVKAKLRETGAPLAGEMSGHIFFKERWFGFDDGIYTAARLLEILTKDKRSASEIFKTIPDSINTPELKVAIAEEAKFDFIQRLLKKASFAQAEINTVDGIRADFDDGWGLVRPSNTTPYLILRFEADSALSLARIQQIFAQEMLAVDPSLELPF
jgi:phosphomannomutase/phosphoglucomutase